MAGLMLGSLRALWPWQSAEAGADGESLEPARCSAPTIRSADRFILAATGAAIVVVLIIIEAKFASARTEDRPRQGELTTVVC